MEPTTEKTVLTGEFEVTAGSVVAGGRCLVRHEGKVVLVSGVLPGERARVRVTKDEKRYAEASVVEILEPNARRRDAPCPYAGECGGCDWQHAERDLQLEMKRDIVVDAFQRIGELDVRELLDGPEAVGDEFRTRHRIRLSFDPAGRPGLLRRGTHDVVPIDDCLQMEEAFAAVTLPWARLLPPWHKVTIRHDDENRAVLVLESEKAPNEKARKRLGKITKKMERPRSIVGLVADAIPLGGDRNLRFHVKGKIFRADATSFFQGSRPGTDALLETVEEFLGDDREGALLDLYAGVGLFAVLLGKGFRRVVASEADARAVKHLKHNLKRNAVRGEARAERAEVTLASLPAFVVAPAAEATSETDESPAAAATPGTEVAPGTEAAPGTEPAPGTDVAPAADAEPMPETVILDPPRIGLTKEARRALVARSPRRIVSISCDPATGARDVGVLVRAGWRLERLRAIDLFPTTAHVETVALLVRDDSNEATTTG